MGYGDMYVYVYTHTHTHVQKVESLLAMQNK